MDMTSDDKFADALSALSSAVQECLALGMSIEEIVDNVRGMG